MDTIAIILVIIAVAVVVAVIAWLLYKAGFKIKEITAKAGPLEAKMERKPGANSKAASLKQSTVATQEATAGGRIKNSTIKAPAEAGAKLKQQAKGTGSSISDSNIELT